MLARLIKNIRLLSHNRIPAQLVIQMTNHCNARCPQCGMRATARLQRSRLASEDIRRILDAAGESGVRAVSFTGGEPFLFEEDLLQYLHYAGQSGIPYIRTGTNGSILPGACSGTNLTGACGWRIFAITVHADYSMLAGHRTKNAWIVSGPNDNP